jgi:hypothetical protein
MLGHKPVFWSHFFHHTSHKDHPGTEPGVKWHEFESRPVHWLSWGVFFFLPPLEKCRPLTIPSTSTEVTVKLSCARHTDVLGGMEVSFHSFLTSAKDVVAGQRHVPATSARYPWLGGWVSPTSGPNILHTCISAPARKWTTIPQTFSLQPTAYSLHYTHRSLSTFYIPSSVISTVIPQHTASSQLEYWQRRLLNYKGLQWSVSFMSYQCPNL